MPVFKHPEPPLNINGEMFSAIELLEAGIAHPSIWQTIDSGPIPEDKLVELIVTAATGFAFDRFAPKTSAEYTNWLLCIGTLDEFFKQAPDLVLDVFHIHLGYGRFNEALEAMNAYNDMRVRLAEIPDTLVLATAAD